jgi:hypothetical protein
VTRVRLLGVAALTLAMALPSGCAKPAQGNGSATEPRAASSPTASPTGAGHRFGETAPADNGQVQATVLEYRQPVAPDVPTTGPAGNVWGAADVQLCVSSTAIFDISVSPTPWELISPDGPPAPPTLVIDGRFPQPAYPTDHRPVHPGDCVRGWIVFVVPVGAKPTAITYAPPGATPVAWVLP